jgi:hypothetical protein
MPRSFSWLSPKREGLWIALGPIPPRNATLKVVSSFNYTDYKLFVTFDSNTGIFVWREITAQLNRLRIKTSRNSTHFAA